MSDVQGRCHEDFAPVREAFENNFAAAQEVGASVAVSLEGELVVDLWGGYRDAARRLPWQEDTIVNVYSTTKTMAALCAAGVGRSWRTSTCTHPSQATGRSSRQNGKEATEVRHFLSHSAGLAGMDEPKRGEDLYDWDGMVDALARQAPWWEPGTASGYHALTQGYLIGEIVRRVTGRSLGTFFAEEVAGPLQADFHIGTAPQHFHRIGELVPPESGPAQTAG
jgi:CubicO group peptidase (beta-lactamase class C family)